MTELFVEQPQLHRVCYLLRQKKEKNMLWQAKISDTLFDKRSPVNKKGPIQ